MVSVSKCPILNSNISKKMKYCTFFKAAIVLLYFLCVRCGEGPRGKKSVYSYIAPDYKQVQIKIAPDSIRFPLTEETYNMIKAFNVFNYDKTDYISFYDNRSESINIYSFGTQKLISKLLLKNLLPDQKLYNTTVFVKNFDSIYISNELSLCLLDSSGLVRNKFAFTKKPYIVRGIFDNTTLPVFRGDTMYVKARSYLDATSLKDLREWKALYSFNLKSNKTKLHYHLPEVYQNSIFGSRFFDYNYCYNDRGNFVFSFPADPNIYETDLSQNFKSYYGKSQFQKEEIEIARKTDLLNSESKNRSYLLKDSYGAIFFDPFRKRYLRVAKQKLSDSDYLAKKRKKRQWLTVFDERFKIIGESLIDEGVNLDALFFAANGNIYARVDMRDDNAIHFVKLAYSDNYEQLQLTKK